MNNYVIDCIEAHFCFKGPSDFPSDSRFYEEVERLSEQIKEMVRELAAKYNIEVAVSR